MTGRRQFLRYTVGVLAACRTPRVLMAQTAARTTPLTEALSVVDAGGANLVALSTMDGLVLVDSGPAEAANAITTNVRTLFNTHYHADQTGNNATFAASGAEIVAHDRTRQWMSTGYWVPGEDRFETARPETARPTRTFQTEGSLDAGSDEIDYGHLPLAHTSGDIYVLFKSSNVIAVGDVASPVRDPALDYYTGAWIGGRVDAMDVVLGLSNEETRIVPAHGPVMTRAGFEAERDMMEEVRERLFAEVRQGKGPEDMLADGLLDGLPRTWQDPYRFLYDAAKGLWAHHNKINRNVV